MVRILPRYVFVLLVIIGSSVVAAEETNSISSRHESAVEMAREGKHSQALKALDSLIQTSPDFYPAKRDYVVIAIWMNDCKVALAAFERIKNRDTLENYLVIPVSECLEEMRRVPEAKKLLETELKRQPEDTEIKDALDELYARIKLDGRDEVNARLATSESDTGSAGAPAAREWQAEVKYSHQIKHNLRTYARLMSIVTEDKQLSAGEITRAGVGVSTWLGPQYLFDAEVSTDVEESGRNGARANLTFNPDNLWEFSADYSTYAEDAPLRGRVANPDFKAIRGGLNAAYHTNDFRWQWSANYTRYHFNDTNRRKSIGTAVGYAFELKEKREQRVILEFSHSSNTRDATTVAYFNPEQDQSVTVNYRIDLVYDSNYDRHLDHITLFAGSYNQQNFDAETIGGIRYEKDIEFSEISSISLSAEYADHVYDGNKESETSFSIAYNRKI